MNPLKLNCSLNLFLAQKPDAYMPYVAGHEEDGFLKQLDVSLADIEPKADLCSQVINLFLCKRSI